MKTMLKTLIEVIRELTTAMRSSSLSSQTWMTETEAAEYLRISKTQLLELRNNAQIKYKRAKKEKSYGKVFYNRKDLDAYMETLETFDTVHNHVIGRRTAC